MNLLSNSHKAYFLRLTLLSFLLVPVTCSFDGLMQVNSAQAQKKSTKTLKRVDVKKKAKGKAKKAIKSKAAKKVKKKVVKKPSKSKGTLKKKSRAKAPVKSTRTQINPKSKSKTSTKVSKPSSSGQKGLSSKGSSKKTFNKGIVTKDKTKGTKTSIQSPKRSLIGRPTKKSVNGPNRTIVESTKNKKTTTTKTTTTTKRTQKKRVTKKTSQTNDTVYQDDTYQDNSAGYAPAPAPAPAPAYGGGMRAPINCRPQGGRLMVNAGFGTQNTEGLDDSQPTYMIGAGYRSNMIGLAAEAQFADYKDPASRSSYRGQLRLYLPVGQCMDLYPLIGLSRFEENDETTPAIDLGLGVDLNLGGSISLGARYTRSFFTDKIENIRNKEVEASNTMIFQLGLYF
jgi:hypothetical protein